MTEHQKQDKGCREGDDSTLGGSDIKADAVADTGHEHAFGAYEKGAKPRRTAHARRSRDKEPFCRMEGARPTHGGSILVSENVT